MILSTQGFQASLTKMALKKYEDAAVLALTFKHVCEGENQDFLDDLQDKLKINNISCLFENPVRWNKLALNTLNFSVNLKWDEVDEFNAFLESINVTQKFKEGIPVFEYQVVFSKEVAEDNLDRVLQVEYLNRKEENSVTGKKELVRYQLKVSKAKEVNAEEDEEMEEALA